MATVTPTVLIVSRDAEVKQVTTALQADGLLARTAASARELQRVLNTRTKMVAVVDAEILLDDALSDETRERLNSFPSLVLLQPEAEMVSSGGDPQRTAIEEY